MTEFLVKNLKIDKKKYFKKVSKTFHIFKNILSPPKTFLKNFWFIPKIPKKEQQMFIIDSSSLKVSVRL